MRKWHCVFEIQPEPTTSDVQYVSLRVIQAKIEPVNSNKDWNDNFAAIFKRNLKLKLSGVLSKSLCIVFLSAIEWTLGEVLRNCAQLLIILLESLTLTTRQLDDALSIQRIFYKRQQLWIICRSRSVLNCLVILNRKRLLSNGEAC